MKSVDDFRLRFGKKELVPIVLGGMGVDISTAELALECARLGGVGHISDAMVPSVSDRRFRTKFIANKTKLYKYNVESSDKSHASAGVIVGDSVILSWLDPAVPGIPNSGKLCTVGNSRDNPLMLSGDVYIVSSICPRYGLECVRGRA